MRSAQRWIGLGCAAALAAGGCESGDKPRPGPEAVAASTKVSRIDAAPAAPAVDAALATESLESFPGFRFVAKGVTADQSMADKLLGGLPSLAECEDGDAVRIEVAHADVDHGAPGVETVVASLTHGVLVLVSDKVTARSAEAAGTCQGSQAELVGVWIGQVVPDPEPEIVVIDQSGGRNVGATTLTVYKDRHGGKPIATIFTALLSEYEADAETSHVVGLAPDGTIVADAAAGKVGFGWDPAAFKFVAKDPAK